MNKTVQGAWSRGARIKPRIVEQPQKSTLVKVDGKVVFHSQNNLLIEDFVNNLSEEDKLKVILIEGTSDGKEILTEGV